MTECAHGAPDERPETRDVAVRRQARLERRRFVVDLLRPHQRRLAFTAALIVVSSGAALSLPALIGRGIDQGVSGRHWSSLVGFVGLSVAAALLGAGADNAVQRLSGSIAESATYDVRTRLWGHIQAQSLRYFDQRPRGEIVARMTTDVDAIYALLAGGAVTLLTNLLVLVGTAAVLGLLDPLLALLVGTVLPVVAAGAWAFGRRSEDAYRAVRRRTADLSGHIAASVAGLKAIQAFCRESPTQDELDELNGRYWLDNLRTVRLASIYGPGVDLVGSVALFLVLVVGGTQAADHALSIGTLTACTLYVRRLFAPLVELTQLHNTLQAANSGFDRIVEELQVEPAVVDAPDAQPFRPGAGEVRFEGVDFGYGRSPVVHDVTISVRGGETLAVMGTTGAGKSTLGKLLARLYDPWSGRITIDNQDLRGVTSASLRAALATVPQEPFIFAATVHDNIAFGRPGASRQDVQDAARAVGADAFIMALEGGYDAIIGDGGRNLSGGQRQLIALSRVWLATPRVVILDEPTSSLDPSSEQIVLASIARLVEGRTAVIISHRPSTIALANRVAIVEHGHIVEVGTAADLRNQPSRLLQLSRQWAEGAAQPDLRYLQTPEPR